MSLQTFQYTCDRLQLDNFSAITLICTHTHIQKAIRILFTHIFYFIYKPSLNDKKDEKLGKLNTESVSLDLGFCYIENLIDS